MEKIIRICNICGGIIAKIKRVTKYMRQTRRDSRSSPKYFPRDMHICNKCRIRPNVKKAINNQRLRFERLQRKEATLDGLWKEARKKDKEFTDLINQFEKEYQEEKKNAD